MDLATGIGLVGGMGVVFEPIMIDGGNFAAYFDKHAVIVIFDGAIMATTIRIVTPTDRGLDVSIVDQDGRSMFAEGSTRPNDRTRRLLERLAPTLAKLSNRIAITGFTASTRLGERDKEPPWELSSGRAVSVRDILAGAGVTNDRFAYVSGKADTEPLFPDNPFLPANRRVTLTLLSEAPPTPAGKRIP